MLKRILFLLALAFLATPLLFAQITTSSVSGVVKGPGNEPLIGATITATHLPTGSKYATISRGKGEFTINNMKPGGPYSIVVSFVGMDQESFEDVYLKLAESFVLNSTLSKVASTLENVILTTSRRNTILNATRTGAVTNISRRQLQQLPSISRSINDFTRATPQSNGSSIAGGNFRQNNFTIDGADFNNSFGIGTNLPANGSPISVDALDEISVNITPFDVRQSGFIGSAINAVTRSGTNQFTGTYYKYFRSEKTRGDKVGKVTFIRPKETFKQWGASFGGPLIKNKLFFFFNYENEKQPKSIQTRFAASASAAFGSTPQIARPTQSELNTISQYLADTYGYITGPYDNYTTVILRKKLMGRIDWNINNKNHFNVRYSQVKGGEPNPPSTSTTGTGNTFANGAGRTDNNALWFKNSNYFQGANFFSFESELNSTFGRFANILRGTYTFQNDSRESDSQIFPFVDILKDGTPFTSFGYEPFTFGNLRQVKMYSVVDNLTFKVNKHNFMFGAQADFNTTINGFQRFATSYYRFNSWDDFVSATNPNPSLRVKPTDFALTYSTLAGFPPVFSSFKFRQYSAYAQDEIAISDKFKLTLGIRFDLPQYPDSSHVPQIRTHPLVLALSFDNNEKLNTGVLPHSRMMVSPRIGFNWDLYGDRSLQIRGGTGIFTGKIPFVWIVSQSGDAGMIQVTQSFNSPSTVPGPFTPDPFAYRPAVPPAAGTVIPTAIDVLTPKFKNPQTWKSSLAVDTKLPWGIIGTFEAIYNRDIVTPFFRNANMKTPAPLIVTGGYADNRMIYGISGSGVSDRFINTLNAAGQAVQGGPTALNAIVLDNGTKGYYFSMTAKLEKTLSKGFSASVAYTKTMNSNLFDGGGDQPLSAWQGTATVSGSNFPVMGYASFNIPDRVIGALTWRKEYCRHMATSIAFLYQGSIDGRFSYTYSADFNRDGVNFDLIYIPKDANDPNEITFVSKTVNGVTYSAAQQGQLFENYIQQDKYLKAHRGQYAERNGAQIPWRNQLDVKFLQDFYMNVGKKRNTLQFSCDIFNAGNLLNTKWGKSLSINASSILVPQNVNNLNLAGNPRPTFQLATDRGNLITSTFRDNVSVFSTYFIQFGVRYMFN